MIDITHKQTTHRKATARAIVACNAQTVLRVKENTVPKGNVLEAARVAALFAVKKTSDIIPDCHPLPVESTHVSFSVGEEQIEVFVEVQTVYKTGVEVEAMHGASVAALTLYDMLKPIDKNIEIRSIKLLEKSGGKSDYTEKDGSYTAHILVCSDSIFAGKKQDSAGKTVMAKLEACGVHTGLYQVIPDDIQIIQEKVKEGVSKLVNFIIVCGGTGLSPRDVSPDAIKPLLEKEIPAIMESARNYGQQRTPYAMLSRGVAGFIKQTLVLTIPGSTRGAQETMEALFPYLLHLFFVKKGKSHN